MLIPSGKALFENISSRDYYTRSGELKNKKFDGLVHIVFPDFEEAIIFSEGQAVTALQESKRWLTVGDELVDAAENKAITAEGKMFAYELQPGLLHVFIHKKLESMVETELGPYMTARLLIGYLETERSTSVLKLEDKRSTGYVFFNFGKRVGAVYNSPDGRTYDDKAIADMDHFKEHASATIYFMELSGKYLKSKTESHVPEKLPSLPKAIAPPEPVKPLPAEDVVVPTPAAQSSKPALPVMKPVIPVGKPVTAAYPPKPKTTAQIHLMVAMSEDRNVRLVHRSRQQTLEALEDKDVAWVDKNTLKALHSLKATIAVPGGREYAVTLKEAAMAPGENRYIILPRKLRARLLVGKGTIVEVRA